MLTSHIPELRRRILIAGGGIAGTKAAALLKSMLRDRAEVGLISDQANFEYKPDRIAFTKGPARTVPLEKVGTRYGVEILQDRVIDVDPDTHHVLTARNQEIRYDYLILATGAAFDLDSIPGVADHVWPFWHARNDRAWQGLLRDLTRPENTRRRLVLLLAPGNGCPDPIYYLAESANDALVKRGRRNQVEIVLATPESHACEQFRAQDAWMVEQYVEMAVDRLYCRFETARIEAQSVVDRLGRALAFDRLVVAPPQKPSLCIPEFYSDGRGFPIVSSDTQQVPGYGRVYVVGDLASGTTKQAYHAVRQAQVAATDIANQILGRPRTRLVFPDRHLLDRDLEAWQRGDVFRSKNRVC